MSAPNVASGCGVGPGGFDVQNAGGTLFTRPIQRCWAEKKNGRLARQFREKSMEYVIILIDVSVLFF